MSQLNTAIERDVAPSAGTVDMKLEVVVIPVSDVDRAKRVARKIRSGLVEINGGKFNPVAPFGGFKQSGHGREYGKFGLEEYLEVKALQL